MPRPRKLIPAYIKHRASGQAICTINGKDYYLGRYGTKASELAYDQLITEWISSGRSPSYGQPGDGYTVVELAADFLRYAKTYYGVGPQTQYPQYVRALRPVTRLYGKLSAAEFSVVEFKAIRQLLMDPTRSRGYINAIMARVVAVFKWAAAEGRIPASVPQNLSIIPGLRRGRTEARETASVLPVDDAIVEATLPHLPVVVADMVRFQRLTGCRPSEVCILRPCNLDRSGDVWLHRPAHHKTEHHGRDRAILIGPKAQVVLLRYLARDAEAYCFQPRDSEAKRRAEQHTARKTAMSCGNVPGSNKRQKPRRRAGDCYTTASYRRAITRACEKAGVQPWTPNRLRHSTGTEVRRKFGLEAAQVILGHASAQVTQVYAERDLAKGLEVARRIG